MIFYNSVKWHIKMRSSTFEIFIIAAVHLTIKRLGQRVTSVLASNYRSSCYQLAINRLYSECVLYNITLVKEGKQNSMKYHTYTNKQQKYNKYKMLMDNKSQIVKVTQVHLMNIQAVLINNSAFKTNKNKYNVAQVLWISKQYSPV